jgi:hypothetical protein
MAQCGLNLLTNPDFEAPSQPAIGNNLTGVYAWGGWTMTGGPFNVIKTNASSYGGGPDNAQSGVQYIDIENAGGTLYQDFTITGLTVPVAFGGYFSSRETSGYVNWTASIDIVDLGTSTVVSSSASRLFTIADGGSPAQETWYYLAGNTTLPPGNYRFVANMGNFGNFDHAELFSNCLLATHLNSFTANYTGGNTLLNWICEASTSLSHFEIEKSIDGNNFNSIGSKVYSTSRAYSFTDINALQSEKAYYRLKMVDHNGSFTYSNVVFIKTKGALVLQLSPNPASNQLTVSGMEGKGQVKLFDMNGRLMMKKDVSALQTVSLDISQLSKGAYIVKYFNGANASIQKFNKQ